LRSRDRTPRTAIAPVADGTTDPAPERHKILVAAGNTHDTLCLPLEFASNSRKTPKGTLKDTLKRLVNNGFLWRRSVRFCVKQPLQGGWSFTLRRGNV